MAHAKRISRTSVAVTAAIFLALMGGASPAQAGDAPGGPSGNGNNCTEPLTRITTSGSTIKFNGYLRCEIPLSYTLQIVYQRKGGSSLYSNQKVCRQGTGQYDCGLTGVTKTLTDSFSGQQDWCMSTFADVPGSDGKSKRYVSTLKCIKH